MINNKIIPTLLCIFSFISLLTSTAVAAEIVYKDDNYSDDGYRSKNYRSPTPTETNFATVVDAQAIVKLLKENDQVVIVDVIPLAMDNTTFIQAKPHEGIINSIWLPNVGFGEIDKTTHNYLVDHLNLAMHKNSNTKFIFYCKTDCWMSWNAARRAASLGFKNIFWYKNGIEGWKSKNFATQLLHPQAFIRG